MPDASTGRSSGNRGRIGGGERENRYRGLAERNLLDAQLAGQAFGRRGLKGGAPVLRSARATYLSIQWSGVDDRRLAAGCLRTTRI